MTRGLLLGALAALLGFSSGASAQQVNLQGYLIALSACEANKKRDSDNPGNVRLEVMHAYKMIARNTTPGTHYQVKVPGAPETEARWVGMSCGAFAPQDKLVLGGGLSGRRWRRDGRRRAGRRQRGEPARRELAARLLLDQCRAEQGRVPDADRQPARCHAVLNSRLVARRPRQQGHFSLLLQPRIPDPVQSERRRRQQHQPLGRCACQAEGGDARHAVGSRAARMVRSTEPATSTI